MTCLVVKCKQCKRRLEFDHIPGYLVPTYGEPCPCGKQERTGIVPRCAKLKWDMQRDRWGHYEVDEETPQSAVWE